MITAYKRNHIIKQLQKYDYTDVQGKTDEQLIKQLAKLKALHVNLDSSDNKWF